MSAPGCFVLAGRRGVRVGPDPWLRVHPVRAETAGQTCVLPAQVVHPVIPTTNLPFIGLPQCADNPIISGVALIILTARDRQGGGASQPYVNQVLRDPELISSYKLPDSRRGADGKGERIVHPSSPGPVPCARRWPGYCPAHPAPFSRRRQEAWSACPGHEPLVQLRWFHLVPDLGRSVNQHGRGVHGQCHPVAAVLLTQLDTRR